MLKRKRIDGTVVAIDGTSRYCRRTATGDWDAHCVLAGVFRMARKVFAGSGGRAAAGFAAYSAGILRAAGHGTARPAGKNVECGVRSGAGIYISRAGDRFPVLQFSFRGAAADELL